MKSRFSVGARNQVATCSHHTWRIIGPDLCLVIQTQSRLDTHKFYRRQYFKNCVWGTAVCKSQWICHQSFFSQAHHLEVYILTQRIVTVFIFQSGLSMPLPQMLAAPIRRYEPLSVGISWMIKNQVASTGDVDPVARSPDQNIPIRSIRISLLCQNSIFVSSITFMWSRSAFRGGGRCSLNFW